MRYVIKLNVSILPAYLMVFIAPYLAGSSVFNSNDITTMNTSWRSMRLVDMAQGVVLPGEQVVNIYKMQRIEWKNNQKVTQYPIEEVQGTFPFYGNLESRIVFTLRNGNTRGTLTLERSPVEIRLLLHFDETTGPKNYEMTITQKTIIN